MFLRNTNPAPPPDHQDRYDQRIEPAGRYMIWDETGVGQRNEGWASGTVTFTRPLHLDWGGQYGTDTNWKAVLAGRYDAIGKALADRIRADGYDGIITHDRHGPSEIIDLTGATA